MGFEEPIDLFPQCRKVVPAVRVLDREAVRRAVERIDPGGGLHDGVRIRTDRQHRRGDIDPLAGQHLPGAAIGGGDAEAFAEGSEVFFVGVGRRDDFGERIGVVHSGVVQRHQAAADRPNTILGLFASAHDMVSLLRAPSCGLSPDSIP